MFDGTTLLYIGNVVCASGQSALGKQYAKRGGHALSFNINKAASGAVLFLIWGLMSGFSLHGPTVLFGLSYGLVLCLSMHTGFQALRIGPLALSSMMGSFSLIVPFLVGVICLNESVTVFKIFGLILLLTSIFLINVKKEGRFSKRWLLYAVITLLANGICSVVQKIHQLQFPTLYRTEFMFWALLCVSVMLCISHIAERRPRSPLTFSATGVVTGIMNCMANYMVLYLSATENASVLFPIVSVANIITVWGIGVVFFKERLQYWQAIGLAIGIPAIVLLKW